MDVFVSAQRGRRESKNPNISGYIVYNIASPPLRHCNLPLGAEFLKVCCWEVCLAWQGLYWPEISNRGSRTILHQASPQRRVFNNCLLTLKIKSCLYLMSHVTGYMRLFIGFNSIKWFSRILFHLSIFWIVAGISQENTAINHYCHDWFICRLCF